MFLPLNWSGEDVVYVVFFDGSCLSECSLRLFPPDFFPVKIHSV